VKRSKRIADKIQHKVYVTTDLSRGK